MNLDEGIVELAELIGGSIPFERQERAVGQGYFPDFPRRDVTEITDFRRTHKTQVSGRSEQHERFVFIQYHPWCGHFTCVALIQQQTFHHYFHLIDINRFQQKIESPTTQRIYQVFIVSRIEYNLHLPVNGSPQTGGHIHPHHIGKFHIQEQQLRFCLLNQLETGSTCSGHSHDRHPLVFLEQKTKVVYCTFFVIDDDNFHLGFHSCYLS